MKGPFRKTEFVDSTGYRSEFFTDRRGKGTLEFRRMLRTLRENGWTIVRTVYRKTI